MRDKSLRGVFFVAFGAGIILARILPVWGLICLTGLALICLGRSCLKR